MTRRARRSWRSSSGGWRRSSSCSSASSRRSSRAATRCWCSAMGGGKLSGEDVIARYLARAAAPANPTLYGTPGDALSAAMVDQWVHRAAALRKAPTAAGLADGVRPSTATSRCARRWRGRRSASATRRCGWRARHAAFSPKLVSAGGAHVARWWKYVESLDATAAIAQVNDDAPPLPHPHHSPRVPHVSPCAASRSRRASSARRRTQATWRSTCPTPSTARW